MFPASNWFLNKYDLRGHLRTSMSSTDETTHTQNERERYIHTHVGAYKTLRILLGITFQQYIILKALN